MVGFALSIHVSVCGPGADFTFSAVTSLKFLYLPRTSLWGFIFECRWLQNVFSSCNRCREIQYLWTTSQPASSCLIRIQLRVSLSAFRLEMRALLLYLIVPLDSSVLLAILNIFKSTMLQNSKCGCGIFGNTFPRKRYPTYFFTSTYQLVSTIFGFLRLPPSRYSGLWSSDSQNFVHDLSTSWSLVCLLMKWPVFMCSWSFKLKEDCQIGGDLGTHPKYCFSGRGVHRYWLPSYCGIQWSEPHSFRIMNPAEKRLAL